MPNINYFGDIKIFLDLSAAFNCVNHKTLDRKLELYKFSKGSRDLLSSYLSFRSQCVSVQGKKSTGVKQGSIPVWPFLYNNYT